MLDTDHSEAGERRMERIWEPRGSGSALRNQAHRRGDSGFQGKRVEAGREVARPSC